MGPSDAAEVSLRGRRGPSRVASASRRTPAVAVSVPRIASDQGRAELLGRYPPVQKIRAAARPALEEIEKACKAHGKRLLLDPIEQFIAPAGR